MILTMDAKRRLTVPAALGSAQPGDIFEVVVDTEEDAIVFRRINRDADWLAVLKECPVSMDNLPPRQRGYFRSRL
jgi:bifunctional DNA-binding transcriptional regulator/antitoxin component of YhaV-PrlF toxin-antitoxin module